MLSFEKLSRCLSRHWAGLSFCSRLWSHTAGDSLLRLEDGSLRKTIEGGPQRRWDLVSILSL